MPSIDSPLLLEVMDASVRRNRQLMLHAENFNVRSYATCAAIIADPKARASACLVVDVDMPEIGGVQLLRTMRESGWLGSGILLKHRAAMTQQPGRRKRPGIRFCPRQ